MSHLGQLYQAGRPEEVSKITARSRAKTSGVLFGGTASMMSSLSPNVYSPIRTLSKFSPSFNTGEQ